MTLLNIAAGVALILFGIRYLRKGLERIFGQQFYAWVGARAHRPWMAALAGLVFGTVAPSSTGQTLVALQLLRAGKLGTDSVLGFLLGANLGITLTVQLIALRIFEYYSLFIVAGLIAFLGFKRETTRGAGQSLLGLGFIFLAMEITSTAARIVAANPDFVTVLEVLMHYPWLVALFAAALTVAMQSSTAVIGLAFAVGGAHTPGSTLVLATILGTNLGIGFTSLLAGYSSWEGRRLAIANLVLKALVAAVALPLLSRLGGWLAGLSTDLLQQGANFHTGFNIAVALLGLLLARPLGRLMERTVKPEADAEPASLQPATHLDPAALKTPVFALANATRETLRLADGVKGMLEGAWRAYTGRDRALAASVQRHDDRIDELNANIKAYLSQIPADTLTPADQQLQFGLLHFSSQLEAVADVIDKSLCGSVVEHGWETVELLPADRSDLDALYRRVLQRFETAITVLATRDRALAQQFLHDGEQLKEWSIATQKKHYERIAAAGQPSLVASTRFLDTFNILRRISGQLNTIGHTFLIR